MGLICWIRYYRDEKVYRESSKSQPFDSLASRPGLARVDPERHFFTPPLKTGFGAAEWVNLIPCIPMLKEWNRRPKESKEERLSLSKKDRVNQ